MKAKIRQRTTAEVVDLSRVAQAVLLQSGGVIVRNLHGCLFLDGAERERLRQALAREGEDGE